MRAKIYELHFEHRLAFTGKRADPIAFDEIKFRISRAVNCKCRLTCGKLDVPIGIVPAVRLECIAACCPQDGINLDRLTARNLAAILRKKTRNGSANSASTSS